MRTRKVLRPPFRGKSCPLPATFAISDELFVLSCTSRWSQSLTEPLGRADITLSSSHPIVWSFLQLPRSPRETETLIGSAGHLLFSIFSPLQSLETVSYRRSCHSYCPCRLSHRPRTTGSIAYCGGVGSASRTETLSQLTRLLVSLLLRPQAMLLVPSTFEYSSLSPSLLLFSHMVSQTPSGRFSRQTVLAYGQSLSRCLDDLSYQVNMAVNACCYAAPWWRGWKLSDRQIIVFLLKSRRKTYSYFLDQSVHISD